MATKGDGYLMTRGVGPSNRLISQHYLWRDELGWNLHPAVQAHLSSCTSGVQIADVATGNGIWLLEEARKLPPASLAYGFDISPAQFPAQGTVPKNVKFEVLDMRDDIPIDLHSRFDVVHVRLVIAAVSNNDPLPILRNLLALLKPGGMLQWSEVAPDFTFLSSPSAPPSSTAANKVIHAMHNHLTHGALQAAPMPTHWIYQLKETFEEQGLQGVQSTVVAKPRSEMEKFWCDNAHGAMEEIVGRRGGVGKEHLEEMAAEREKGIYWWLHQRIVVGRKLL